MNEAKIKKDGEVDSPIGVYAQKVKKVGGPLPWSAVKPQLRAGSLHSFSLLRLRGLVSSLFLASRAPTLS
jgi:hypothetical protein